MNNSDDYGELDYDPKWESSPLQKYMSYKRDNDKITESRLRGIRNTIIESPDCADYQSWNEYLNWRDEVPIKEARGFLAQLRAAGLAETTVQSKMQMVQSFMQVLYKRKVVKGNAAALVCDEANFETDPEEKLERSPDQVASLLKNIPDPQYMAMGVLFGKTGIRNGEMTNIDLMDVHLDHPPYKEYLDKRGIDLHPKIRDKPDTLYIPSEPTGGEEFRKEVRKVGNKRKRATRLALDTETRNVLLDWIAMRPLTEDPYPLWTGRMRDGRINPRSFDIIVTKDYAEEFGFVNNASDEGFSPHWFRHMFTTELSDGYGDHDRHLSDNKIDYLRGDVASDDIKNRYRHDWGDTIRKPYEEAIYKFGIYD